MKIRLFETVLSNGTQVTIVLSKVTAFVKTDDGKLKVYYDNGACDTTTEDYEHFINYIDNDSVYFVGGRL